MSQIVKKSRGIVCSYDVQCPEIGGNGGINKFLYDNLKAKNNGF